MLVNLIKSIILFIFSIVPILIAVAYIILAERKVMASIQRRKGPNVVGLFGLLQPFIDAVKLLTKEQITPLYSNFLLFIFGPIFTLAVSLLGWCFIPFNYNNFYYDFTYSLIYLLIFSSLGVYGLVISGWASNSRYALLGALRAIAQFISYELVLMFCILPIIAITGSANFIDIVLWQSLSVWFIVPLWPIAFIFFIASLAETNRTPFDLPEAEAELVAGYNVEYSSVFFILFMFAEYNSILIMSAFFSLVFLGGWAGPFGFSSEIFFALKIAFVGFCFILIRATQPRLRFDQLMNFCWKRFLPLSFGFFLITITFYMFVLHFEFDIITLWVITEVLTIICILLLVIAIISSEKSFIKISTNFEIVLDSIFILVLILITVLIIIEISPIIKDLCYFVLFMVLLVDEILIILLVETLIDLILCLPILYIILTFNTIFLTFISNIKKLLKI